MVLFVVDGGKEKGYGHVVRTTVLARACVERGLDVSFACTNEDVVKAIRSRGEGFHVYAVPPKELIHHTLAVYPHVLVADADKTFTAEEVRVLHQAGIFLIEWDATNGTSHADEVINGFEPALYGAKGHRYKLTGRDYFVVDELFSETKSVRGKAGPAKKLWRLFLCFGGSDPGGLLEATLEHMQEIPECLAATIHAIAGFNEAKGRAVANRFSKLTGLHVHVNADAARVSQLMGSSDLGIVSFGSILVEALCTELPVFVINPTRAHEQYAAKVLAGIFAGAGRSFGCPPRVRWEAFREELGAIMGEPLRIVPLQSAARGLVDGKGARRIAEHIYTLVARRPPRHSRFQHSVAR
jgi:spore coat polysaccharide biosynthesis predicted glycosyltransferase SpsG